MSPLHAFTVERTYVRDDDKAWKLRVTGQGEPMVFEYETKQELEWALARLGEVAE